MGADLTKVSSSDINPDENRLKELSLKSISKLHKSFAKNSSSSKMNRSKILSVLGIDHR